jgi:hypothetical protein
MASQPSPGELRLIRRRGEYQQSLSAEARSAKAEPEIPPSQSDRRRRQVVRQRSAKPPPPVQIRAAPPILFRSSKPDVNMNVNRRRGGAVSQRLRPLGARTINVHLDPEQAPVERCERRSCDLQKRWTRRNTRVSTRDVVPRVRPIGWEITPTNVLAANRRSKSHARASLGRTVHVRRLRHPQRSFYRTADLRCVTALGCRNPDGDAMDGLTWYDSTQQHRCRYHRNCDVLIDRGTAVVTLHVCVPARAWPQPQIDVTVEGRQAGLTDSVSHPTRQNLRLELRQFFTGLGFRSPDELAAIVQGVIVRDEALINDALKSRGPQPSADQFVDLPTTGTDFGKPDAITRSGAFGTKTAHVAKRPSSDEESDW